MNHKKLNSGLFTLTLAISSLLMGCSGGSDGSTEPKPEPKKEPQANNCAGQPLASDMSCFSLNNRDVIVYKPAGDLNGIALFLHGAPGTPQKVSRIFNARALADAEGLLSVSPQGKNALWGWESINDGDNDSNTDVDFIVSLITQLRAENNIVNDKVYIFGYSAGGFMGYKLACQIPEQITAIVSLAGQFRGDFEQCPTSTPITLHHFHSPQDSEVPMNGRTIGEIKSVSDTLAHWLLINGCSEEFTTTEHPKLIEESAGTTTKTWQGCIHDVSFSEMKNVPHETSYNTGVLRQIYSPIFDL